MIHTQRFFFEFSISLLFLVTYNFSPLQKNLIYISLNIEEALLKLLQTFNDRMLQESI